MSYKKTRLLNLVIVNMNVFLDNKRKHLVTKIPILTVSIEAGTANTVKGIYATAL